MKTPIPTTGKAQKSLSIIVLNRDGESHLRTLFRSFLKHNTYQAVDFIVVDHASSDRSAEVARSYRNRVRVRTVESTTNRSFAYSNNRAAELTSAEYLLFLNNDVCFTSDALGGLIGYLDDPRIGVVGARLVYPADGRCGNHRVQHRGIKFRRDLKHGFLRPYNVGESFNSPSCDSGHVYPAVTGAAMLCRREEFLSIGGFWEGYEYGYEDVDLCLRYLHQLGKVSVVADDVCLIHDESSTQRRQDARKVSRRRAVNQGLLVRRFGYAIKRAFQEDLATQAGRWSDDRFVAAFAVTEVGPQARAGDLFTAQELALACRDTLGWETRLLARNVDWYDLAGVDLLCVMRDDYDLRRIRNASPVLLTAAWMRNWFERWAARPWFDQYDLYLCSSEKGRRFIQKQSAAATHLFRIATNHHRFNPHRGRPECASDYCFAGHYWSYPRDIEQMLDPERIGHCFALYGRGWEHHRQFKAHYRGPLPYDDLPAVYASTRIVIDDAVNHITKQWASVNSRVFDALAAGALVVTSGDEGAEEVFGDRLPIFRTAGELKTHLLAYLKDDRALKSRADELRQTVLDNHTYTHRALQLGTALSDYRRSKFRVAIKVPVPNARIAPAWGEYHFARALKRALKRRGHSVRIDLLPDWDTELGLGDDVVLVLRGLSAYEPRGNQINLMWNISHPDRITPEEYDQYDHIFVASQPYAEKVRTWTSTPAMALLQCTDPGVFDPPNAKEMDGAVPHSNRPQVPPTVGRGFRGKLRRLIRTFLGRDANAAFPEHSLRSRLRSLASSALGRNLTAANVEETLLFVGNSRKPRLPFWYRYLEHGHALEKFGRAIVLDALRAGLQPAVYGLRWEGIIPKRHLKKPHIPNEQLRHFYATCEILLNDHWPTMRDEGFISNRVFDAGACGAFVISDAAAGLSDLFGNAVVTYRDADHLKQLVEHFLQRPAERRRRGDRLREIVLSKHTFDHRVEDILDVVRRCDRARRLELGDLDLMPGRTDQRFPDASGRAQAA